MSGVQVRIGKPVFHLTFRSVPALPPTSFLSIRPPADNQLQCTPGGGAVNSKQKDPYDEGRSPSRYNLPVDDVIKGFHAKELLLGELRGTNQKMPAPPSRV